MPLGCTYINIVCLIMTRQPAAVSERAASSAAKGYTCAMQGNAQDMYTSEGTGSRRAPSPLLVRPQHRAAGHCPTCLHDAGLTPLSCLVPAAGCSTHPLRLSVCCVTQACRIAAAGGGASFCCWSRTAACLPAWPATRASVDRQQACELIG